LNIVLSNLKTLKGDNNAIVTYDSLPIIYQMVQLFQNLISNGIKYINKKISDIHISIIKKNDEYVFSVTVGK